MAESEKKRITITINEKILKDAKILAIDKGMRFSAVIEYLLLSWLCEEENDGRHSDV